MSDANMVLIPNYYSETKSWVSDRRLEVEVGCGMENRYSRSRSWMIDENMAEICFKQFNDAVLIGILVYATGAKTEYIIELLHLTI